MQQNIAKLVAIFAVANAASPPRQEFWELGDPLPSTPSEACLTVEEYYWSTEKCETEVYTWKDYCWWQLYEDPENLCEDIRKQVWLDPSLPGLLFAFPTHSFFMISLDLQLIFICEVITYFMPHFYLFQSSDGRICGLIFIDLLHCRIFSLWRLLIGL